MNDVNEVLAERPNAHGAFRDNAILAQAIKHQLRRGRNWEDLPFTHQEALDMIASKISRILSGDPKHADHWLDIAGYATLVLREL